MNEKIASLINNPEVDFYLIATPLLTKILVDGTDPRLAKLRVEVKTALLEGKVFVLDKQDVLTFVLGGLEPHERFLLENGDIRVVGNPQLKVTENKGTL